jgi:hypothetical protein
MACVANDLLVVHQTGIISAAGKPSSVGNIEASCYRQRLLSGAPLPLRGGGQIAQIAFDEKFVLGRRLRAFSPSP